MVKIQKPGAYKWLNGYSPCCEIAASLVWFCLGIDNVAFPTHSLSCHVFCLCIYIVFVVFPIYPPSYLFIHLNADYAYLFSDYLMCRGGGTFVFGVLRFFTVSDLQIHVVFTVLVDDMQLFTTFHVKFQSEEKYLITL